MGGDELFGELPEQSRPQADGAPLGAPRLREPKRDQIELRAVDIESLIGEDHPVRVIWAYVEGLDLSELEDRIKARGDRPGHPATSPRLLLALWLYATSDGVGSARALERLCDSHDVYRWLCGGVSVNYHTLADFRVGCADLLDRLLSEHLAALAKAGLVDLDTLAQDGVRIRASAGAASFRREATLDRHLAAAQAVVEELKREVEARSDASNQRIEAAKERAARERSERVKAAQTALAEIKRQRQEREEKRGNGKKPKEPRASTTDARCTRDEDGRWRLPPRPTTCRWRVPPASRSWSRSRSAITAPIAASCGRCWNGCATLTGRFPARHLADGGFCSAEDIEWAHGEGVEVYCPPTQSKHGTDPYLPRRGDGAGVLAWRTRMASEAGKAQYKRRSICECIHARWRNWDLRQLTVRGIEKVRAVVLCYALTNNILQGNRLASA